MRLSRRTKRHSRTDSFVPSTRSLREVVVVTGVVQRTRHSQVPFEVLESLSANKALFNLILENYPNLLMCRSSSANQVNKPDRPDTAGSRTSCKAGGCGNRSDTPPLVMKMKLKQSKKSGSMGSGVLSPLDSQVAVSPPHTYTADNSPERHPKAHHLKRQFSTTQSSYLKSLPYHR